MADLSVHLWFSLKPPSSTRVEWLFLAATLFSATSPFAAAAEPSIRYYGPDEAIVEAGDVSWSVDCKPDAMTDERLCEVSGGERQALAISFSAGGDILRICITGHDFPGRTGAIRFDNKKAVPTDEDGCIAGEWWGQMANASRARMRSVEWPYDEYIDRETSLAGVTDAVRAARRIIHQ